jgi:hypothetical protein
MDGGGVSGGRIERAMDLLRRVLQYEASVGALIEVALWLAIPYLSIGFVWAVNAHRGDAADSDATGNVFPTASDVAAFGLTAASWPASIHIANACPAK